MHSLRDVCSGTCAVHVSNFHAEDEAGLMNLSFSSLHHVNRDFASSVAIFVQDLYWGFPRAAALSFTHVRAVSKRNKCLIHDPYKAKKPPNHYSVQLIHTLH